MVAARDVESTGLRASAFVTIRRDHVLVPIDDDKTDDQEKEKFQKEPLHLQLI